MSVNLARERAETWVAGWRSALLGAIYEVCDCDTEDSGHDDYCPAATLAGRLDRVPVLPVFTRVRVARMGTATVVAADGVAGDALGVLFDKPYPPGFHEGTACVGREECEVLTDGQ